MNYYDDVLQLGITAIIWSCWCVIHSLSNSNGIISKALPPDSRIRPYYRIVYSLFAAITLVLVYWMTPRKGDVPLWEWHGVLIAVKGAIWVVALALGFLSFRFISILDFLGLTALGIDRKERESSDRLITSGIYGEIRNPQFLAGLLLLWARDLTRTGLLINVILSLYLLIGARIEAKRLLQKFGEDYRRYMSRVPRFIPRRFPPLRSIYTSG
ncbi:MAG: methyltransferase family protein [Desulfomonilaceae bacterium]